MTPSAAFREALRVRSFSRAPRREDEAARALAALGEGVLGVIFFGSQRTQASPDRWSAYDFFVAVQAYRPFYESLKREGRIRRSARFLSALNRVLAPSQISLALADAAGRELRAKCSVLTLEDLTLEASASRHDHFTIGRLFQPSDVLYAADVKVAEALLDVLVSAHAETYHWVRPWLPARFDAEGYCRTLLRVSLSREIRPEPTERRADALYEAQRAEQAPIYALLLHDLAKRGELSESSAGIYALARPVRFLERVKNHAYFQRSLARATARWFKHVLTFHDWLDYILHKVRRHAGEEIVLTPRERAWPLVFLWPKLFRYLRRKNDPTRRAS